MADIKLKDRQGDEQTYGSVSKILVQKADGSGYEEYGSGGGETCTLTVGNLGPPGFPSASLYITTISGVVRVYDYGTYEIIKNSMIYKAPSAFSFVKGITVFSSEIGQVISDCEVDTN